MSEFYTGPYTELSHFMSDLIEINKDTRDYAIMETAFLQALAQNITQVATSSAITIDLSADYQSTAIDLSNLINGAGSVQLDWEDIDAFNSTSILQGSNDGTTWNDLGGASGGIILTNEPDTQIWSLTKISHKYLRLDYSHNSVSDGTGYLQYLFGK